MAVDLWPTAIWVVDGASTAGRFTGRRRVDCGPGWRLMVLTVPDGGRWRVDAGRRRSDGGRWRSDGGRMVADLVPMAVDGGRWWPI
jgi:hypothetical protein